MPSQGPLSPGTATGGGGTGDVVWTSAGNILTSNNIRATAALMPAQTTFELSGTDFGFAIPSGATIDGIVVDWERSQANLADDIVDSAVRIVKGGVTGATDRSNLDTWTDTDTYQSYGGAADLWGETWTPADINATNFGAVIKAQAPLVGGTAQIDHVRITVHYTEAGSGSAPPAQLFQCREVPTDPLFSE